MDSDEVFQCPKCLSEGSLAWVVEHAVMFQNQDVESDANESCITSEDRDESPAEISYGNSMSKKSNWSDEATRCLIHHYGTNKAKLSDPRYQKKLYGIKLLKK